MLRGEKVILRAIEREDIHQLWDLYQNIDLVILSDGSWSPRSLASFEKWFDKRTGEDQEFSRFAIIADDKVIGDCNLHGMDRQHGVAELGIGIYDRDYLGKGYGRDAIRIMLHWAFHIQNWRKIWLETAAYNERAIRAYKACGFLEEGRLRQHQYENGKFTDIVIMGLLRTEWEALQT